MSAALRLDGINCTASCAHARDLSRWRVDCPSRLHIRLTVEQVADARLADRACARGKRDGGDPRGVQHGCGQGYVLSPHGLEERLDDSVRRTPRRSWHGLTFERRRLLGHGGGG